MRRMKTALLLLACAGTTQALANETSEYQLSPEQSFDSNQNWDSTEETEQMSGTRPSNHSESDDDRTSQMPGTMPQANDTDAPSSSASSSELSRGMIRDEKVGIKPQVGVFVFNQSNGETASRIAEGIQLDANIMSMISDDLDNVYFGPSSGAIFSHLGSPGSNVIGTDSDTSNAHPGANMLLIPANLKMGYTFADSYRLSAHAGGNVIYRSVANSLALGTSSTGSDSSWNIFPNAGLDLELGFGKNVSLLLRPDVTFTPGDELFTGTVGLGISIG